MKQPLSGRFLAAWRGFFNKALAAQELEPVFFTFPGDFKVSLGGKLSASSALCSRLVLAGACIMSEGGAALYGDAGSWQEHPASSIKLRIKGAELILVIIGNLRCYGFICIALRRLGR